MVGKLSHLFRPNATHHLFLEIKMYWNSATFTYLRIDGSATTQRGHKISKTCMLSSLSEKKKMARPSQPQLRAAKYLVQSYIHLYTGSKPCQQPPKVNIFY